MIHFILKQVKLVTTLFILDSLLAFTTQTGLDATNAEIAELELKKNELYKQISDAIEESAINLQEANVSEAKEGIAIVTNLKKQLNIINNMTNWNLNLSTIKSRRQDAAVSSSAEDDATETTKDLGTVIEVETSKRRINLRKELDEGDVKLDIPSDKTSSESRERRKRVTGQNRGRKKNPRMKGFKPFEDKILNKRFSNNKSWERYLSRLQMKQRVEEWLENKRAEKEAIKKYKQKTKNGSARSINERCPRMGERKKSKKGGRKQKKFRGYYPCCRKCCKASYLGCL